MTEPSLMFGNQAADRKRLKVASAIAGAVYFVLGIAVWQSPAKRAEAKPAPAKVRTFNQKIDLRQKPKSEPLAPAPKAPEPAPPETPTETAEKPSEPQAAPQRTPRKRRRKRRKRARKTPAGPKTVVLKNTVMQGSVQVYSGSEDVLGSPEVAATKNSTRNSDGPSGDGPQNSRGTAPKGTVKTVSNMTAVVVAPRVKKRIIGRYPKKAPRRGRAVRITMSLRINKNGRVSRAKVVSRPRFAGKAFDREARRVAKATRFSPATRGGKPVSFTIRYVVEFRPK